MSRRSSRSVSARLAGVDEMVLSLSAKGLTMVRSLARPLDRVYPVVFIDCINVKIREGQVANRPIYMAHAVTAEGHRDILGMWAGGEGGEAARTGSGC